MKKTLTLSLLFLFLITNSGMAVSLHWCGHKLSSIDFFSTDKHKCGCGKKAIKPGCCKDKTITLKVKSDLAKANQFAFNNSVPKFIFSTANHFDILSLANYKCERSEFYYPPPIKPKVPDYILYGVFLI